MNIETEILLANKDRLKEAYGALMGINTNNTDQLPKFADAAISAMRCDLKNYIEQIEKIVEKEQVRT